MIQDGAKGRIRLRLHNSVDSGDANVTLPVVPHRCLEHLDGTAHVNRMDANAKNVGAWCLWAWQILPHEAASSGNENAFRCAHFRILSSNAFAVLSFRTIRIAPRNRRGYSTGHSKISG